MSRLNNLLAAGLLTGTVATMLAQTPTGTLNIQVDKSVGASSPLLHGLMTEEINYSYDGGLYAELIRNRTFQDNATSPVHWSVAANDKNAATIAIDKTTGPSTALPMSLKVSVAAASATNPAGVQNDGFWGIPVRPHTQYKASFYAKADAGFSSPIQISLVDNNTGAAAASAVIPSLTPDWKRYSVVLTTAEVKPSAGNHFALTTTHPGVFWLQLVSVFPPTYAGRDNGNRKDIMELLAAMKPSFLRLPGGNYLEGDHIPERYEWRKTIGAQVDRPTHPSPWGYHSSDGLGLLEFLEWCEDLKMQPLLAVYAGYSMKQEHIDAGPTLEPYVQDALDEIEYVSGSTSTKWGAVRARNGHPKPFALKYVEVGNEDWFDKSKSYEGRFAQFYDAIKKSHPEIQVIATMPVTSRQPDILDDHFYRKAEQFFDDVHHYDKTSRTGTKIMVGEWATREGDPTTNFNAALGDAAWMTGMERNSDVIVMHSYAPLFVNVNPGGMQWKSDLIGYDAMSSYGSPSYYAQVMFSSHRGTQIVDSNLTDADKRIFYSVTSDPSKGVLYLKLVNATATTQPLNINLNGAKHIAPSAKITTLHASSPTDSNSITEPRKIVPVGSTLSNVSSHFAHELAPYSIQVIEFSTR
jgi:alpha-L-arabinofuranosidase